MLGHVFLGCEDSLAQRRSRAAEFAVRQNPSRTGAVTVSGAPLHRASGPPACAWTVESRMRSASKGISSNLARKRSPPAMALRHFHQRDLHGITQEHALAVLLAFVEIVAQPRGQEERPVTAPTNVVLAVARSSEC